MLKIGLNKYKKMKKGKIILAIKSNRKTDEFDYDFDDDEDDLLL